MQYKADSVPQALGEAGEEWEGRTDSEVDSVPTSKCYTPAGNV